MKTIRTLFAGLALILLAPVALHAQSPLSLEIRGGIAVPMGDFADGAQTGVGFGGTASFQILPVFDVYAGYSWTRFGIDDDGDLDGADVDLTDSGFAVGGRLYLAPIGNIAPWVQGGVLLHQLEISGSEGGVSASVTSDRGVGFEAGGGVAIPVGTNISFMPGVRYRQYPAQFGDDDDDAGDVQYIALDLGVRLRF
ncbi:hypothetical protein BH24GEM3_BH24GEM3_18620 [soil metagenome]|jgi:opacity protein-like surface antigen